MQYYYLVT